MASRRDLQQAIQTAVMHLKTGGVLLVVVKTKEIFQTNYPNSGGSGLKDGIHVALFENNCINPLHPNTYEATFVYLVREGGELTIKPEQQVLGLFSQEIWNEVFSSSVMTMQKLSLGGIYDSYILNDGEYPLVIFSG